MQVNDYVMRVPKLKRLILVQDFQSQSRFPVVQFEFSWRSAHRPSYDVGVIS